MATFEEAKKAVDEAYNNLFPIVDEIVKRYTKTSDDIVKTIGKDMEKLSKEQLRANILKLSSEAYFIGEVKERASLRQELAEMIYKENVAKVYSVSTGTQKDKDNAAILASTTEKMAELLHSAVESQLKTKIQGINNIVENLKSVLISRISEDKNLS